MDRENCRLLSYCGTCGREADKKIIAIGKFYAETYDDSGKCPYCGGVYHRVYGKGGEHEQSIFGRQTDEESGA